MISRARRRDSYVSSVGVSSIKTFFSDLSSAARRSLAFRGLCLSFASANFDLLVDLDESVSPSFGDFLLPLESSSPGSGAAFHRRGIGWLVFRGDSGTSG